MFLLTWAMFLGKVGQSSVLTQKQVKVHFLTKNMFYSVYQCQESEIEVLFALRPILSEILGFLLNQELDLAIISEPVVGMQNFRCRNFSLNVGNVFGKSRPKFSSEPKVGKCTLSDKKHVLQCLFFVRKCTIKARSPKLRSFLLYDQY